MDARDTEKAFDKLLARTLRESPAPGGAQCPEPDILAAYCEHSLSDSETSLWEAHFSTCARCQQVLAAMAISEPKLLRAGEAVRLAAPWQRLGWRWLAPAAAAAAAVTLWIALRPAPIGVQAPAKQPSAPEVSARSPAPPAESVAPQAPASATQDLAQNIPPPAPGTGVELWARMDRGGLRSKQRTLPGGGGQPETTTREERGRETVAGALDREKQSRAKIAAGVAERVPADEKDQITQQRAALEKTPARPAVAPGEAGALAEAAPQAAGTGARGLESETRKKAEPSQFAGLPPGTAGPAPAPATPTSAQEQETKTKEAQPEHIAGQMQAAPSRLKRALMADRLGAVLIVSADRAVLWRVGAAGKIERSRDAGRHWLTLASNVAADLTAGSAPSATVCWVVGRAGTILRTTDAEHWERVSSPASADWIAVRAQDAQNASVISADKRHYTTHDGGQSWRAQ